MQEPKIAASMERPHAPARLKKRAEFVNAAKGQRFHARSFTLQAVRRAGQADEAAARFGFTVTKRIGGAVLRNRVRRRLKEALRLLEHLSARGGHDYVLVAREAARTQAFPTLQEELTRAIAEVHAPKRVGARPEHRAKSRSAAISTGTAKKTKD